jgi:hypothetical protein
MEPFKNVLSNVSATIGITSKREKEARRKGERKKTEKCVSGEREGVGGRERQVNATRVHVNVDKVRSRVFPHNWS